MRLIDLDEIECFYLVDSEGRPRYKIEIDEGLPEVKAIPIEWIKRRLQKAVDFTHSEAEGKFIYNGCVVEVVSASFTANVLLTLLEDWEKENTPSMTHPAV